MHSLQKSFCRKPRTDVVFPHCAIACDTLDCFYDETIYRIVDTPTRRLFPIKRWR